MGGGREEGESEEGRGREGETHRADPATGLDSEEQLQSCLCQTFSLFGSDVFRRASVL